MSDWDFLWDLEGQELLDAMATGATYEEWAYIKAQEYKNKNTTFSIDEDHVFIDEYHGNIALFIDGENISSKHAKQILEIANEIGTIAVAKVYGLQKDEHTKKWTEKAKENEIKDIRLCGKPEENKVDNKIIRDMKKTILDHSWISTICIASCDGGYAEVLKELRDLGLTIVAIATKNLSHKLKEACDEIYELKFNPKSILASRLAEGTQ